MSLRTLCTLACLMWILPAVVFALTTEEIVLLKQNGVSERTIQLMLQSEIEAQRAKQSSTEMKIETIDRPDGQSVIVYSTGGNDEHRHKQTEERLKEEHAWRMLRNLIVDTRQSSE